ncbi:MAG: alpha-amylase family protein, partial [Planctomycetota bacterium]
MHIPRWSLFYDFHTMPACPDVGAGFDVDAFVDHLQRCGVDYVVFPARCNLGMAYYNTEVGIRHPSLEYDLLGRLVEACNDVGIAVTAYINVGLSHEEGLRNRGWLKVSPEGKVYHDQRLGSFFRLMCYNTGYAEHLLAMVREVVSGYGVAGLFLDCLHRTPCIGHECIDEMKQRGMDWSDTRQQECFARDSQVRMARRIAEQARAVRDDLLLYFNGVAFEDQADIGTYLEYECLPTGGWGYEMLPYFSRYLRKLGKPVLNMTGRFHRSWGDFGGIRTEASLEYDLLKGLANTLPPTVGGHYHPRGDINRAVNTLVEKLYTTLHKLEPWTHDAEALADVAVVFPPGFHSPHQDEFVPAVHSVSGATRMLCELKQQFDVVSKNLDLAGYRVLVLPDEVTVDDPLAEKLRAHLDAGGRVVSSAR